MHFHQETMGRCSFSPFSFSHWIFASCCLSVCQLFLSSTNYYSVDGKTYSNLKKKMSGDAAIRVYKQKAFIPNDGSLSFLVERDLQLG